jgi:hypothetical protein
VVTTAGPGMVTISASYMGMSIMPTYTVVGQ